MAEKGFDLKKLAGESSQVIQDYYDKFFKNADSLNDVSKDTWEYLYNYFYVAKMRAQNYKDMIVTPYMRDMAIKSYPFLFEAYQVVKSFADLMLVLLRAILVKMKKIAIAAS